MGWRDGSAVLRFLAHVRQLTTPVTPTPGASETPGHLQPLHSLVNTHTQRHNFKNLKVRENITTAKHPKFQGPHLVCDITR